MSCRGDLSAYCILTGTSWPPRTTDRYRWPDCKELAGNILRRNVRGPHALSAVCHFAWHTLCSKADRRCSEERIRS